MKPGILGSILSLIVALMFALGYMNTHKPVQLLLAVMCLIISAVMFLRHKRLKSGGKS
jgi:hypothetical protein